ncbi:MAG: hypothetical protein WD688_21755 [Candidatus Binatia bacterium]
MKLKLCALVIFLVTVVALTIEQSQAAQPLTKVTMTTGSFSEREAATFVAQDQGFFRRYGLDLTFVQVRIRRLKAEDLVDDRFVRKLDQEGLF